MLQRTDEISIRVGPYDLSEDCLPDRSSVIIRVAVADLERSLLDPRYEFHWDKYYSPNYKNSSRCGICVAGGIMAQSVGATPNRPVFVYSDTHLATNLKLHAVSAFSGGLVAFGLAQMAMARGEERCEYLAEARFEYRWPHRTHNRRNLSILIPQLETLAADLEAAGL